MHTKRSGSLRALLKIQGNGLDVNSWSVALIKLLAQGGAISVGSVFFLSISYHTHLPVANSCHHHPCPKKGIKSYLLWSFCVPCPDIGFRDAPQWPCGSRAREGRACCGVDERRADGSCPAGQPRCSRASSFARRNPSSHTQSKGES